MQSYRKSASLQVLCTHWEVCYDLELSVYSSQQVQQRVQNWSYWISGSATLLIAFSHVRINLSAFLKIVLHLQGTRLWPPFAVPPLQGTWTAPQLPARQSPRDAPRAFTGHQTHEECLWRTLQFSPCLPLKQTHFRHLFLPKILTKKKSVIINCWWCRFVCISTSNQVSSQTANPCWQQYTPSKSVHPSGLHAIFMTIISLSLKRLAVCENHTTLILYFTLISLINKPDLIYSNCFLRNTKLPVHFTIPCWLIKTLRFFFILVPIFYSYCYTKVEKRFEFSPTPPPLQFNSSKSWKTCKVTAVYLHLVGKLFLLLLCFERHVKKSLI